MFESPAAELHPFGPDLRNLRLSAANRHLAFTDYASPR